VDPSLFLCSDHRRHSSKKKNPNPQILPPRSEVQLQTATKGQKLEEKPKYVQPAPSPLHLRLAIPAERRKERPGEEGKEGRYCSGLRASWGKMRVHTHEKFVLM
jgi:hypothetical protein